MKQLEKDFSTDLTNKLNISFKDNSNINIVSMADFQKYIKQEKKIHIFLSYLRRGD